MTQAEILILRGGIPRPIGNFPESLSQRILAGMILIGRLGVPQTQRTRPSVSPRRRIMQRPGPHSAALVVVGTSRAEWREPARSVVAGLLSDGDSAERSAFRLALDLLRRVPPRPRCHQARHRAKCSPTGQSTGALASSLRQHARSRNDDIWEYRIRYLLFSLGVVCHRHL